MSVSFVPFSARSARRLLSLATAGLVLSIIGTAMAGIGFLTCTLCVLCTAGAIGSAGAAGDLSELNDFINSLS